ncbi:hypothetical protein BN1110_00946 [bacterium YEK0313]|nr:hypothetical protein BN1110_00946 [bacterium YEK0313]
MTRLNTAPARLATVAAGALAALALTDYLAFRMLGLFLAPNGQGGYTIAGGGAQHGLALANLAALAVLAALLAALVTAVYRGRRLDRALVVMAGYAGACLVAALVMFLVYAGLGSARTVPSGGSDAVTALGSLYLGVKLAGLAIGVFALAPAAAIIAYAERRGMRSPVFYGAAGTLSAVLVASVVFGLQFAAGAPLPRGPVSTAGLALLFVLPGLCGGLAYWLVAGRTAGRVAPAAG